LGAFIAFKYLSDQSLSSFLEAEFVAERAQPGIRNNLIEAVFGPVPLEKAQKNPVSIETRANLWYQSYRDSSFFWRNRRRVLLALRDIS